MANEEKMNVDIENQEDFAKKKKIIVISLSVALVFITLIAGFFLVKKNKESNHENSNIGEVVNENDSDHENNNDDDHENDSVIINENDYFFNKTSGQITTNVLLSLFTGILFFFWENDKLPEDIGSGLCATCGKDENKNKDKKDILLYGLLCCGGEFDFYCGPKEKTGDKAVGYGIFEKANLFGFASLGFLIIITLLVELILHFLLGSISHLLSKDKNKKYLHTLKMFWKKRKQLLFSFSKTKIFFIALTYLLCGFVIAMIARLITKKLKPCCCCGTGEIIPNHNINCCLGYCKAEYEYKSESLSSKENNTGQKNQEVEIIGARKGAMNLIRDMRSFRMKSFPNQN